MTVTSTKFNWNEQDPFQDYLTFPEGTPWEEIEAELRRNPDKMVKDGWRIKLPGLAGVFHGNIETLASDFKRTPQPAAAE